MKTFRSHNLTFAPGSMVRGEKSKTEEKRIVEPAAASTVHHVSLI